LVKGDHTPGGIENGNRYLLAELSGFGGGAIDDGASFLKGECHGLSS
jgi:hypothetical protein